MNKKTIGCSKSDNQSDMKTDQLTDIVSIILYYYKPIKDPSVWMECNYKKIYIVLYLFQCSFSLVYFYHESQFLIVFGGFYL